MRMRGNVTQLRDIRKRTGMGRLGEGSSSSSSASAQSGANVVTPVTTQVTTAVSPIFNISAGNSGGGGVTQTGSTMQTATPSAINDITTPMQFGQPQPQIPPVGMMPGGQSEDSSLYDSTGNDLLPASYSNDSMYPTDSAFNQSGAGLFTPRNLLIAAMLGVAAWVLFTPSGKREFAKISKRAKGRGKARPARRTSKKRKTVKLETTA